MTHLNPSKNSILIAKKHHLDPTRKIYMQGYQFALHTNTLGR
jgi:hypothetical protein